MCYLFFISFTFFEIKIGEKNGKLSKAATTGILILITFMVFILLFTYLSLNLKNIDFGYEMQKLVTHERQLKEEIDKLKCDKARLLNLERVEKKVIEELGYQYPDPDQFIRVIARQEAKEEKGEKEAREGK